MLPKFYCLTVKNAVDRNARVAKRFADAGIDVEFYNGVHGSTVGIMPTTTVWDAPEGEWGQRWQHPFRGNPGKLSITISKLMLYQRILDRSDDVVMIMENDVVLVDNFKLELEKSIAALPEDWEVCHAGWCCTEGKSWHRVNDRVSHLYYPLCCHAMLWKRSCLETVIDQLKIAYWGTNSDIIFEKVIYHKLKHYVFQQALASQEETHSEAGSTVVWQDIQGWFDWELLIDEQLTSFHNKPAVVVEVGSWKGRSTAYLASEIKRRLLGDTVKFYAVDTWRGNANEPDMKAMIDELAGDIYPTFIKNMNDVGVMDYILPIRKDSVEAAADFADGAVSWCFLDGDHSYEGVMRDLVAWYPKVHFNSCMAGHDIERPEVRRAVTEFFGEKKIPWRQWKECWIVNHCHREGQ